MTKVISLSDRAYAILAKLKKDGDSFSDVILRLAKKGEKRPLTSYAGKWAGEDAESVFHRVRADRKRVRSREVEL